MIDTQSFLIFDWIDILPVLLSLRRQDASRRRTHTLLDHVRGDNVLPADYLTGELLAHQSEQMHSFLLAVLRGPTALSLAVRRNHWQDERQQYAPEIVGELYMRAGG